MSNVIQFPVKQKRRYPWRLAVVDIAFGIAGGLFLVAGGWVLVAGVDKLKRWWWL